VLRIILMNLTQGMSEMCIPFCEHLIANKRNASAQYASRNKKKEQKKSYRSFKSTQDKKDGMIIQLMSIRAVQGEGSLDTRLERIRKTKAQKNRKRL
jgi:hypothetical protein